MMSEMLSPRGRDCLPSSPYPFHDGISTSHITAILMPVLSFVSAKTLQKPLGWDKNLSLSQKIWQSPIHTSRHLLCFQELIPFP